VNDGNGTMFTEKSRRPSLLDQKVARKDPASSLLTTVGTPPHATTIGCDIFFLTHKTPLGILPSPESKFLPILSREAAARGLEAFFHRSRARIGARTWNRDEPHER